MKTRKKVNQEGVLYFLDRYMNVLAKFVPALIVSSLILMVIGTALDNRLLVIISLSLGFISFILIVLYPPGFDGKR